MVDKVPVTGDDRLVYSLKDGTEITVELWEKIEKEYAEGDVLVYEATTLRPITQMLEVSMKEKNRSSTLSYVEIQNLRPEVH